MNITTTFLLLASFAAVGFGQMTSDSLRGKYGAPLDRETFTVGPGLEMVVDYAISGHLCPLKFPSSHNIIGDAGPGIVTTKMVNEALDEVLPPGQRGKELGRRIISSGALSVLIIEYERVTFSQPEDVNKPAQRGEITITFKGETCRGQDPALAGFKPGINAGTRVRYCSYSVPNRVANIVSSVRIRAQVPIEKTTSATAKRSHGVRTKPVASSIPSMDV